MPEYTKDEALAFINAMRLTLEGKVGFRWMVEKLSLLGEYIESLAVENERLNAYLDRTDVRGDYEAHAEGTERDGATPETP